MLSSTALLLEIQIITGTLLWNKVQASNPAAVMGLPDSIKTECSQLEEKLIRCSLGPQPVHADHSRETLLAPLGGKYNSQV